MGGSQKVWVQGSEGKLEALWLPAGEAARSRSVVLCHPHPLYGGTMETKLLARTARRASQADFQTLRFNFRGVGQSEGVWGGGEGERMDAGSALDYMTARLPDARLALFGFSFGALVGLAVGAADPRVHALVGVAPPAGQFPTGFLKDCSKPTLIIGAGRDEIVDPKQLVDWADRLGHRVEFDLVDGADHLFTGQTDIVAERTMEFLDRVTSVDPNGL